jgi:uncharacterized protein
MDTQNPNTNFIQGETRFLASSDERTLAILSHVLTFVGGFIAPLIIYLVKKDESTYVTEHAKESLNFQLTMIIAVFISIPLTLLIIGVFMLIAIGLLSLICVIIASIKASDNRLYRYPINFRLIK